MGCEIATARRNINSGGNHSIIIHYIHNTNPPPVCTENLNPNIMVMKPAENSV